MTTTALKHHDDPAFIWFKPRPDQPERLDQQTAFVESQTKGVKWLIGGNGAGTTTVSMYAVVKFLMSTPPPRKDTPFWIISNDFQTCMETCWAEKLEGMEILPRDEIDYERILWFRESQNWPLQVPLKSWPNRPKKNWRIEFRSHDQGRKRLQGRSIGGFCFVEQFRWHLLTEVLRGCREYNFPGSKMCEFTPVDPDLSIEIERMIEEDKLPPGWEIYRANTQCALEAGHISEEWFEEFFGMVSDEMRETRMTGQFATYEGAIYQGFNHLVHLVGDDVIDHPPSVSYRRAIDWGAGRENPFCCLFGYFNSKGQWFIFDEYYSNDQKCGPIEHLCNVQDVYPWPKNNPNYGITWADPSSPSDIRTASKFSMYSPKDESGEPVYRDVSIQGASNDVLQGIYHVQFMLKPTVPVVDESGNRRLEPRLFIHKDNCPNLARQMRTYRWKQSTGIGVNPEDAKAMPVKKNDHAVDALRYLLFSEAVHTGNTPGSMRKPRRANQHGVFLSGKH